MQYQTVNKICGSCPLPAQAFSVGRQEGERGDESPQYHFSDYRKSV